MPDPAARTEVRTLLLCAHGEAKKDTWIFLGSDSLWGPVSTAASMLPSGQHMNATASDLPSADTNVRVVPDHHRERER